MGNSDFRSMFTKYIVGTVKFMAKNVLLQFYTDISLNEKRINNQV